MDRYFLVRKNGKTHRAIETGFEQRKTSSHARRALMYREFPKSKKDKRYAVVYWQGAFGGSDWGIQIPADECGCRVVPHGWKFRRGSVDAVVPKTSVQKGKNLADEMSGDVYKFPGAMEIGESIGIKPVMSVSDLGLSLKSPEIIPANDGRFILKLTKEMMPPSDCKRISDIDVEKLTGPAEK